MQLCAFWVLAVAQPINKAEVMRTASYMKPHFIAAP